MPAKSVRTVFAGPPNRALTAQTHYEFILHPETHKNIVDITPFSGQNREPSDS
jgi:hypothetical protein